jgi:short-subunit dehydrogenase
MALNALVTGGGTGIGRGIALALARRGVAVALLGRRPAPLALVAGEIAAAGGRGVPVRADLARSEERVRAWHEARQALGPLDILVHNGGVFAGGALESLSSAELEEAVGTNLTAGVDLVRLALSDLRARRGSIALVGSSASTIPLPYATLYSAGKAGLRAFGESLRYELEEFGVNLLMVYPPDTATAMTEGMREAAGFRQHRLAAPDQIGERIAEAIFERQRELRWGAEQRSLQWLYRHAPWLVHMLFRSQRARCARAMAVARRKPGSP